MRTTLRSPGPEAARARLSTRGGGRPQQAAERELREFLRDLLLRQPSVLTEPARQPEDHPDQAERRDGRVHVAQAAGALELGERVAHDLDVLPHSLFELPA